MVLYGLVILNVLWCCGGVVVWRCGGVVVWWCGGVVVWWCGGVVVWCVVMCERKYIIIV